jgi:imidazoleglycerol-phosphate dehydratase
VTRTAHIIRNTTETAIDLRLNLDGTGTYQIDTGVGFFDHMLAHVAKHGCLDLNLKATGDLHIDEHHLVEDVGISFGKALTETLGDKRGIERFGTSFVTMDEALARTVIDLSGRSYLVFHALFSREAINGFSLEMVKEFFQAVANEGKMNLHIALLYGGNAHHQAEGIFKSFGRALREAVQRSGTDAIPSTKGSL